MTNINFDFFEERPLEEVTLAELQSMVRALSTKRHEKDQIKVLLDEKNEEIDTLELKIMSVLDNHNLKNFNVPGVGTVYSSESFRVAYPKDPVQAEKVRQYCLQNGLENELTINSQRLQSLFKAQKEVQERNGNLDMENVIPGVGAPQVHKTIGLRKG